MKWGHGFVPRTRASDLDGAYRLLDELPYSLEALYVVATRCGVHSPGQAPSSSTAR